MAVCDLPVPIIQGFCVGAELAGNQAAGWFEDAIVGAAEGVFGFAVTLLGWLWTGITATTQPQTDAAFLYDWAGRVFGITLPISVGLLVAQVVTHALKTHSLAGIGKAVMMTAVAVIGTFASLPIIHVVTSAVDSVADGLAQATFGNLDQLGDRVGALFGWFYTVDGALNTPVLSGGGALAGAVGFTIFGVLLILGGIATWAALLIRSQLLYIAIVMGPIAIMGLGWSYTKGWFTKWVALVIALIFTPLAVVIVFGLGISALEGLDFAEDFAGAVGILLGSSLMLVMAALVPLAAYRFMSFLGDEVEAGALHRGASDAGARVLPVVRFGRDGVTADERFRRTLLSLSEL